VVLQFDQSRDIAKRFANWRAIFLALALVLITLLPLGWRAAVIVMVSIPLSLASGLVAVYAMGFNLSQLVVAGFILSLGLLVDDSIVVIENVSRHLRMGKERVQAAIDGHQGDQPCGAGLHRRAGFCFRPDAVPARRRGQVHDELHRYDHFHRDGVAGHFADNHPLPREPAAEARWRRTWQCVAALADGKD
jgi:hypothetical protein